MKKYWQSAGLYVLIFVIILAALAFSGKGLMQPEKEVKAYTYADLLKELEEDTVATLEVTRSKEVGDYATVMAMLDNGSVMKVSVPSIEAFMQDVNQMPAQGSDIKIIAIDPPKESMLSAILPSLVMMILMVVLFVVLFGKMQGGGGKMASFGKSRAKMNVDDKNKVTFDNVAGCDEEKAELEELVQFLKNPQKFTELGARIPKGVLLVGPPAQVKRCLPKRLLVKQACRFSPYLVLILWKCLLVWGLPV